MATSKYIVIFCLLLAGCSTVRIPANLDPAMESWKGAPPREIIAAFGHPNNEFISSEGDLVTGKANTVYEYHFQGTTYYDNMILPLKCDRSFEFRNDAVIRWKWSGNYCAVISQK